MIVGNWIAMRATAGMNAGLLFGLLTIAVGGLSAKNANAATWTVCPATCDYTTIQSAIIGASAGDTIQLQMTSPHTEANIVVLRSVTIAGTSQSQTIVQAAAAPGMSAGRVFRVDTDDDVQFRDLTIRHGDTVSDGGGVVVGPTSELITVRFDRVTLESNRGGGGGGLSNFSATVVLQDVTIRDNEADFAGGGIKNHARLVSPGGLIVSDNEAPIGGGLTQSSSSSYWTETPEMRLSGAVVHSNLATGVGGGIYNLDGLVTLDGGTQITSNSARGLNDISFVYGGGVANRGDGELRISDTLIEGNLAQNLSATRDARGGGVYSYGAILEISRSEIASNSAYSSSPYTGGDGGGLAINGGIEPILLERVAVRNNLAADTGGGIFLSNAELEMRNSAIYDNTSHGLGGGIYLYGAGNDVDLENVSIVGNAADAHGGGIYSPGSDLRLDHVTVTENIANADGWTGNIYGDGGGIYLGSNTNWTTALVNSIVADNEVVGGDYPDCIGQFSNGANSLIEVPGPIFTGTPCGIGGLHTGMIYFANPNFLPFFEDGWSSVQPLAGTSPAIDAGRCPAPGAGPAEYDQRGAFRPVDGNFDGDRECDMGAYEYLPEPGFGMALACAVASLAGWRSRTRSSCDCSASRVP